MSFYGFLRLFSGCCVRIHVRGLSRKPERPQLAAGVGWQGRRVLEKLVIANPNPYRCGVTLWAAYGTTAVNGGDSYTMVGHGQPCIGPACWLRGLPRTIAVPADARVLVPFTATVPAKVTSGQYLAGVIGQPSTPPPAPRVRGASGGIGSVGASVVARVAIGVAITVPGVLRPRLAISSVSLTPAGLGTNNIGVTLRNDGNTWLHPKGTVTVEAAGSHRSEAVASGTVLPGDQATLSIRERSVPSGRHHVNITLNYADGARPATWKRTLNFPQPLVTHVSPGTITIVAPSGLPTWATVLLVGLGLVVLLFGTLLFLLWRRRGELPAAKELLSSALSLWRGRALADVGEAAFAPVSARGLENDRLATREALFDIRLRLGEHRELVSELERAVAADPLRERSHAQLMLALYRSGRQADALAAFQDARARLTEDLGIEPGRELRELERDILVQAPELDAPRAGRPSAPLSRTPASTIDGAPLTADLSPGPQHPEAGITDAGDPGPEGSGAGRRRWRARALSLAVVVVVVAAGVVTTLLRGSAPLETATIGLSELTSTGGVARTSASLPAAES